MSDSLADDVPCIAVQERESSEFLKISQGLANILPRRRCAMLKRDCCGERIGWQKTLNTDCLVVYEETKVAVAVGDHVRE